MPWLIVVLGLGLAIAGGVSVAHGYPYMQLEFGWTEVIAGSTAISGGTVTIALGAVMFSLASVRRSIERNRIASPLAVAEPRLPPGAPAEGATSLVDDTAGSPNDGPVASPTPPLDRDVPRAERAKARLAARSSSVTRLAKASPALPVEPLEPPTVAGRYESGGASYILFSDGTIDVESAAGKRRFSSMDDLKAFMAQRSPEAIEADAAT